MRTRACSCSHFMGWHASNGVAVAAAAFVQQCMCMLAPLSGSPAPRAAPAASPLLRAAVFGGGDPGAGCGLSAWVAAVTPLGSPWAASAAQALHGQNRLT